VWKKRFLRGSSRLDGTWDLELVAKKFFGFQNFMTSQIGILVVYLDSTHSNKHRFCHFSKHKRQCSLTLKRAKWILIH